MRRTPIATLVAAGLAAAVACGASQPAAAAAPPQQLDVVAHAHSISAPGANALRPGLVTFHIRDASSLQHGIGVIALHGTDPNTAAKIIARDDIPKKLPFALLGGVPQLSPGGSWTGTMRLAPGRYLLFDDGQNQKGMRFTFTVRGPERSAAPPKTVGTITMSDHRFGVHLPANWDGRGVVAVPNEGAQLHELTFVKGSPGELASLRKQLAHGYPKDGPPPGARIYFAVGGTSPGHTTLVELHLPKGRYLLISLFPDPKTGKPQTAVGLMSNLTVH